MLTKVKAAKLAARSGTDTVIAEGKLSNVISRLAQGEELGTLLLANSEPVTARKQWLAGQLTVKGQLFLDEGAVKVLQHSGKSLLAAGIKRVEGQFNRGEVVACVDTQGAEIARGLTNYGSAEVVKILGHNSDQIERLLGYGGEEEVIHRDNLVLR
jgi:glutamate 5-kinase